MISTLAEGIDAVMAKIKLNTATPARVGPYVPKPIVPPMWGRNNPVPALVPTGAPALLTEAGAGSYLLQEDGGKLLLE